MQFNPQEHIRQLADGSEYLDLKWRLLWLRSEHPKALVETQMVPFEEDDVLCRASISLGDGGGSATAHGSASRTEYGGAAAEEAENRALARALAALGYGTEFIPDDEVDAEPAPTPPVSLMTARSLLEQHERYESDDDDSDSSESEPEAPEPAREDSRAEQPEPRLPEDFSWTKFWAWARARGYQSAEQLNELLGVDDVTAMTPLEVRRMLKRYELEHPPDSSDE